MPSTDTELSYISLANCDSHELLGLVSALCSCNEVDWFEAKTPKADEGLELGPHDLAVCLYALPDLMVDYHFQQMKEPTELA
ncbi:hypothetical protein ACH5RR_008831 [Cinchona calisaya]|uniref:Ubiquitinyl hydrolase 1 n=1 Tax=Cinchona calisaya TaxID=153742 RepID=A0ABD3ACV4_9GENT